MWGDVDGTIRNYIVYDTEIYGTNMYLQGWVNKTSKSTNQTVTTSFYNTNTAFLCMISVSGGVVTLTTSSSANYSGKSLNIKWIAY